MSERDPKQLRDIFTTKFLKESVRPAIPTKGIFIAGGVTSVVINLAYEYLYPYIPIPREQIPSTAFVVIVGGYALKKIILDSTLAIKAIEYYNRANRAKPK